MRRERETEKQIRAVLWIASVSVAVVAALVAAMGQRQYTSNNSAPLAVWRRTTGPFVCVYALTIAIVLLILYFTRLRRTSVMTLALVHLVATLLAGWLSI